MLSVSTLNCHAREKGARRGRLARDEKLVSVLLGVASRVVTRPPERVQEPRRRVRCRVRRVLLSKTRRGETRERKSKPSCTDTDPRKSRFRGEESKREDSLRKRASRVRTTGTPRPRGCARTRTGYVDPRGSRRAGTGWPRRSAGRHSCNSCDRGAPFRFISFRLGEMGGWVDGPGSVGETERVNCIIAGDESLEEDEPVAEIPDPSSCKFCSHSKGDGERLSGWRRVQDQRSNSPGRLAEASNAVGGARDSEVLTLFRFPAVRVWTSARK